MNKLKNKAMICVWFMLSLIPMLFMPLALVLFKSGAVMSLLINKWMGYCIKKLEKYENAE